MLDSRLTVARTWALILIAVLPLAACGGAQSRKAHFMDKGRDYVEHSNYTKARVEFRNALQIAPNDPEVRYQNGWVAEKLGAAPEAAQFYQGALDVQSDHVNARARLGRLFFLYGAYKNALDVVGPGLAKHPDNADLLSVRAAARSRMNDDAEALKDAERAYKLDPRNEDTIAILVGLYTKVGRKDDARVLLIRGTEQIPTSVSRWRPRRLPTASISPTTTRYPIAWMTPRRRCVRPLRAYPTIRPLEPLSSTFCMSGAERNLLRAS
jgi:tetratricopeptide (TPR) repeat protein